MPLISSNSLKPVSIDYPSDTEAQLVGSDDDNKNGIWPRSVTLWMAIFYMALFIVRPWEKLLPFLSEIHFEKIYAILMITAVLLGCKFQFQLTRQTMVVFLFIGALSASVLFAENPSLAWVELYKYLTLVFFFFVLVSVIRTPYQLVFVMACYVAVMTAYLGKSQWEYFVYGGAKYRMGVNRLVGIESTFGDPNSLAGSIVLSLPLALFLWNFRKELTSKWSKAWRKYFSYFLISYVALAVSSLILTNSRSGMISFILLTALIAFRGKKIRQKLGYCLLSVLFLFGVWLMMPDSSKNRFETIWDPKAGPANAQQSAHGRAQGFYAGIAMFKRHPIFGVGIGNFTEYRANNLDGLPIQAHNLYGQVLGETGFLGTGAFLLFVLTTILTCRKVRNLSKVSSATILSVLSGLATACRDTIILLLFLGLAGHNLLRFNWLWMLAFSSLALDFAEKELINRA